METLIQDLRFASRTLLKRPTFTVIAVLTLSLGIGANTAIFSVVRSVLLRPLPFRNIDRLAVLWASNPELARKIGFPDKLPVSPPTFYDWKEARSFEKMAMVRASRASLTGEGAPEMLGAVAVSGEFFQALGTPALIGRTLQPADDESGKGTSVVLSHALWQRRFGGDKGVVGKTIRLNHVPFTVVGVMPPEFLFPRGVEMPRGYGFAAQPDIWIPLAFSPEQRQNRYNHSQLAIGLLRSGVSLAAAQAELDPISQRVQNAFPDSDKGSHVRVEPLPAQLVGDIKPALLILLTAVGLVLLIACINVANLLLAQAAARQKEIAVRTALGAGRARVVRQLLTESALLSFLGGGVGLLVAFWGLKTFTRWIPEDLPVGSEITLDAYILSFTLAVTLLTAAIAGIFPAFHMTRPDLAESLREGTRAGSSTSRGGRMRNSLVVLETAVAVLLIVGAGLLVRSFARLSAIDPGFRAEGVLTFHVLLPESQFKTGSQISAYTNAVLERLRALPGVDHAGMVSNIPMSGQEDIQSFVIEGRPRPRPGEMPFADFRRATPGYFNTMGIRLAKGRLFSEGDTAETAPLVAVIDQALARAYWPDEDSVGKRFRTGNYEDNSPWITVVGVVENVRHSGLHVDPRPQLYVLQARFPTEYQYYVVHTKGDVESLMRDVRSAVFSVNRELPIDKMLTMEWIVNKSIAGRRFNMVLLGIFAGLALMLAIVGIYGITSYSVAQRTREMGLRMALGAQPARVLRMVLWEAGMLAGIGLAAGLILAFGVTRLMASLLFGVPATDPTTFGTVGVGLALVSILAAYIPGRKATRVDPMVALRSD